MYGYSPQGAYPPPQQGAYPPPGGAYPPPQQGAYPPPGGAYPPPQQGAYPPPGGAYPPPQQGAYPPPGGAYPPPQQGSYPMPSPHGAYPPPGGAYPPPQQGAYPPPGGAYPPPPQQGAYPPPGGAYPPPQQGAYPPPGGAYPPKGPYEQQSFASYPPNGYPPQQMGQDRNASVQGYPAQAFPAQGGVPYGAPDNVMNLNKTITPLLTPAECDEAAKNLRDAMKGIGTDEKKLISVLGKYPPVQMNQIIKSYKSNFGKNLLDAVKSETSGNFGKLCCALCMSIIEFDVKCLHEAIDGVGTDDDCLMEILVGRTNEDIRQLCEEYKRKYGRNMEDDVKGDTSGYVRRLYTVLLQGNRDETNQARDAVADAEALYRAGEGKIGTDEMAFISILCNRPDSHLRNVFNIYQQKHGHTFEKAIEKEFSGDIKKALLNLVASIRNKSEYIATLFEKSMRGMGTDDDKLIRLTVRHRAPNVIEPIKEAYKIKYGKSLGRRIKGDTSGDYCKLLLACIKDEQPK